MDKQIAREAAERLRRYSQGDTTAYGVAAGFSSLETALDQMSTDKELLADEYLLGHPADADEPLDEAWGGDEWMLSIGFEFDDCDGDCHYMWINSGPDATFDLQRWDTGQWRLAIEGGWVEIPAPHTRGDLRKLAEALGISINEGERK